MTIDEHILANPVLRELMFKFETHGTPEIKDVLEIQTAKGLVKYSKTVNPDDYSIEGWINHNKQELVDSSVYSEVLLSKLEMMPEEQAITCKWLIDKIILDNITNMNFLIVLENQLKTYKV